jgi:putative ABC transport system substrate-binding protein
MNRRSFYYSLIALGITPPFARAQPVARKVRLGILQISTPKAASLTDQAFLAGMKDHGYVVGQNLIADFRYSNGEQEHLYSLVDELLGLKPDVLVGTQITAAAMKAKTDAVPIVLLSSADPVTSRLVKSLARPGTNVTGMASQMYPLVAKQVDLLVELVPNISKIALLSGPDFKIDQVDGIGRWQLAMKEIAKIKRLTPLMLNVSTRDELNKALGLLKSERPGAVLVTSHASISILIEEVIAGIKQLRIPAIYGSSRYADAGGLISYGQDSVRTFRYAAKFVDRILKGAKPGDLPVEQVSRFELLVNKKAAQEIGIKIPQSVLLRADRVIE